MRILSSLPSLGIFFVFVAGCTSSASEDPSTGSSAEDLSHGQVQTYGVRCESQNNRYFECPVVGRIVSVRLDRDLSGDRCRQGRSWGYTNDSVWVDRGCRGQFLARIRNGAASSSGGSSSGWGGGSSSGGWGGGSSSGGWGDDSNGGWDDRPSQTLFCSSNGAFQYCQAKIGLVEEVHLLSDDSSGRCIEGSTFGRQGEGIWVQAGCQGEFEAIGHRTP